jgi:acyl-CoA thioester hydrolase
MFARTLFAGWADMDFNSHMKNTAYLDKSADIRMLFFAENGFPMSEFLRLKIGPVILKDEVEYFKEVALLQEITVTLALAGMAADGSRLAMRNEIIRADGKLSARVTSTVVWLDLSARRTVVPPAALLSAIQSLSRTDDFSELRSSIKNGA